MSEQKKNNSTSPDALAHSQQTATEHPLETADDWFREHVEAHGGLWESIGLALCVTYEGRIGWVNSSFESLFGHSKAEALGQETSLIHVGPEGLEGVRSEAYRIIERGETYSAEMQLKRKGGTLIWALINGRALEPRGVPLRTVWTIQDVTQRKNVEEALRLSEARLDAAQAQVSLGSWELAPNMEPLYWSRQMYALFGFDAEGGIPSVAQFMTRVHPNDQALLVDAHRRAVDERSLGRIIFRTHPELGPPRYVVATILPRLDSEGRLLAINGTAQDITNTKQTENALRQAELRLEVAQAQAKIGSWEYDLRTRELSVSKEMYQIVDTRLGDFVRERFWDDSHVHPADRGRLNEAFAHTRDTAEPSILEYRSAPNHGEVKYYRVTFQAARDSEGNVTHVVGTLQDVTQSRRAEFAVLENERRLERLLQNSNDIIGVLDANGVQTAVLGQLKGVLGYESEEFLGRTGLELIHPEDVEAVTKALELAMATPGTTHRLEYRARHKSGKWVDLEVVGTSWLHDPGIRGLVLNAREITERKRTEQAQARLQAQLQQSAKMEAVGRLAGGVAHDFNNLLTVIRGNLEFAIDGVKSGTPLDQSLEEISKAAESATALTRQLLTFSRRQIIDPKCVNLNELVLQLKNMLKRLIGEDIALETALASHLGLVRIDPSQFDQVIVNLAVNARDAMPRGGRLTIETANVEFDEVRNTPHQDLSPGPHVMLAIADSGEGMSAEVRARIFEPFFTTKQAGQGTGLGLAMVFGAVKQAGGSIEVHSEVNQGTTFKIYIPRAESDELTTPPHDSAGDLAGHELVLLVEDNPSVRNLTAKMLRRFGYDLLVAENGPEALSLVRRTRHPVDLLLTDVVMPEMNGRELAEHIRQIHPKIKVLFCSGYTEDTIVRHGLFSEHLHLISKPFSLLELGRKLRLVLDED